MALTEQIALSILSTRWGCQHQLPKNVCVSSPFAVFSFNRLSIVFLFFLFLFCLLLLLFLWDMGQEREVAEWRRVVKEELAPPPPPGFRHLTRAADQAEEKEAEVGLTL